MPISPIRNTLTTAQVPLSYLEWGTGESVVLLHGLADHGLVWQSLATALQPRYRCIAPDLRGHGDSGKPDDEAAYDALNLVDDLGALADACELEQTTVIAHSWSAKLVHHAKSYATSM